MESQLECISGHHHWQSLISSSHSNHRSPSRPSKTRFKSSSSKIKNKTHYFCLFLSSKFSSSVWCRINPSSFFCTSAFYHHFFSPLHLLSSSLSSSLLLLHIDYLAQWYAFWSHLFAVFFCSLMLILCCLVWFYFQKSITVSIYTALNLAFSLSTLEILQSIQKSAERLIYSLLLRNPVILFYKWNFHVILTRVTHWA